MAGKILVFVSSAQTLAAHWHGGRITRGEVFEPDENGLAAFAAFVSDARGAPAFVVADTVEEDYRYESLPHATGSDRKSLLERKFRQYYRSSRFVTALPRGTAAADKRRNDRYLFAALTNPAMVEPWLAVIAERGSPLAGVFLSPLLTASILARLQITTPRVLVAAPHRAGLRLTFYKDGELCSSRLTRALPRDAQGAADLLHKELANTRLYLSTMHLDSSDESLNVVFLDHDGRLAPVVQQVAAASEGLECMCVDRATLMRRLGVDANLLDLAAESLYLPALAAKPPAANLAPAQLTAAYQVIRRKVALYAASVAVALVGFAWTGYNLWQAHDLNLEAQEAARLAAAAQAQYKEITRTFPAAPTGSENLVKSVQIYQRVLTWVRSPQPFMQVVSRALDASPEIHLQELVWRNGHAAPDAVTSSEAAGATSATADASPRQSGLLTGEIRPFHGDFRAAIASINAFAGRLARDPSIAQVKVVKWPLNVNPELTLSGDTREAVEHSGNAEFHLEIAFKPNA